MNRIPGVYTFAELPAANQQWPGDSLYTSDVGSVLSDGNIWSPISSSPFEKLLQQKGAVFNGTTDDSAAIQAAIDTFTASAKGKIIFPAGLTTKILSGLIVKSGVVAIDFNGVLIDASGMSNGYALSLIPNGVSPFSRYATPFPLSNLNLLGPLSEANTTDGVFMGRLSGSGEVSGQCFERVTIYGFRDNLFFGDQVYINTFLDVNSVAAYRNGVNYTCTTNSGENLNWHGGRIANCSKSDGSGVGVYIPSTATGGKDINLIGVSIDYCDTLINLQEGRVSLFGGHLENNNQNSPMIVIQQNGGQTPCGVKILGGEVDPTEVTPRAFLIQITNSRAFFIARTNFNTFNNTAQIVNVTAGSPHIDIQGSVIDFAGSTAAQFPSLGSALNGIYNPGFELGNTNGWSITGTGYTATADNSAPHSGTWAGKVVSSSGNSGGFSQQTPCKTGQQVTIKAWVNVSVLSAGSVQLQCVFLAGDAATVVQASNVGAGNWSAITGGYIQVCGTFAAPQGTAYAKINLGGTTFTGTIFIDDCELNVI